MRGIIGAPQVLQAYFPGGRPSETIRSWQARVGQRSAVPAREGNQGHAFPTPPNFLKSRGQGGGQPLPATVKSQMESYFQTDFSQVRVHVGPEASSIGALAFTVGTDLYFAPGQYQPNTQSGRQLLGHELTHVLQQQQGRVENPYGSGLAVVHDPGLEEEAEQQGTLAAKHPGRGRPRRTEVQRRAVGLGVNPVDSRDVQRAGGDKLQRTAMKKQTEKFKQRARPPQSAMIAQPLRPANAGTLAHAGGASGWPTARPRHSAMVGPTGPADVQSQHALQRAAQAKLLVNEREISVKNITQRGAKKKHINDILSQQAHEANMKTSIFRKGLLAMVAAEDTLYYETLRAATIDAAAIGKNNLGKKDLDDISIEETQMYKEMEKVKAFKNFPKKHAWRLLMDGKHQAARGKYGFENERGYMAAMMRGFTLMLQKLHEKLDSDLYKTLHDTCVRNVKKKVGGGQEKLEEGYRNDVAFLEQFAVDEDTWSEEGYRELKKKYNDRNRVSLRYPHAGNPVGSVLLKDPEEMVGAGVENKVLKIKGLNEGRCEGYATVVLGAYEAEIGKAQQEDGKLEEIVRTCQDLDQMHLFFDGNIRTIAFLVLNKMLIENDLSPTILYEPNVFDCKSVNEVKQAVIAGQQRFRAFGIR